jgi:cyclopropane fatty-acyl-phospholipid synthase-like methyltransferase
MVTIDYDILGIKDGEQVLDVGCGEGRHSFRACEQTDCTVCALDIDEENLARTNYVFNLMDSEGKCKGRWLSLRGDVTKLPLKDAYFDRVICSEVLEHIPDDHQAVWELKRVLKDDGRLAISVPTYFSESIYWKLSREYSHQPGGHVRKYRAREIIALLQEHGFHVYTTRYKHALHTIYWLLRCIFGINREKALIPSLYHRFLVWDIQTKSRPIRMLENLLNPVMAKSIVLYAYKNTEENRDT